MEFLTVKNTQLKVSRIGMGGCPLGGYGWGAVEEKSLLAAIHTAREVGINFFDTADTYGLGKSEELLGQALSSCREQVVIADKFGVRIQNGKTFYDNSSQWIESSIVGSLKRLKTDYIDLYQIHYRDGVTPLEQVVEKLEELKRREYIRYYGLSNVYACDQQELLKYRGMLASFQDEYSLANRGYEVDIKSLQGKLELTPLTWGSLGQGILTGKYGATTKFGSDDRRSRDVYANFHGAKLIENLQIVDCLRQISEQLGIAMSAIAIRFILDYLQGSVVLVGSKNPNQVRVNASAIGWSLSKECMGSLLDISAV